jgi:hypothetical protein
LLDREIAVIQRLKRGALFNRLACKPPPLVERSGFQALQLAKLVFFGDVVDFDDGHSGISFLPPPINDQIGPDILRHVQDERMFS